MFNIYLQNMHNWLQVFLLQVQRSNDHRIMFVYMVFIGIFVLFFSDFITCFCILPVLANKAVC